MSESNSYIIEHFAVDKDRELHRLNAQIDIFWEQEYSLYKRLGLDDGMRLLDCGCGSGYLLEKLHTLYASMTLAGIEISDFLFTAASNTIQTKKLSRCLVHKQSIMKIDFPDNTFDFVIVRLVLEHLSDPLAAMREINRVLKVGGRAVFIDNDFDFHVRTCPEVPELSRLYDAYCKARSHDGGNPRIGRQLPQLLSLTGFSDISFDVISANNTITGDNAFHQSEGSGIALQLLHDGYLPGSVYDSLAVHWSEMLKTKGHSMIRLLFAGSGKKTSSAPPPSTDNAYNSGIPDETHEKLVITGLQTEQPSKNDLIRSLILAISQILEISSEKIDPELPLGNLGLDSVGSVMLKNHIENDMKASIPSLEYFHNHSVIDIVNFIENSISTAIIKDQDNKLNLFEEGEI